MVSKSITQQLSADVEFQHRRQNGLDNHNPFDKNLVHSSRLWVNYKYNDRWKFSLAPFSYYTNYTLNIANEEQAKGEYRFSIAAEFNQKLNNKFVIYNRFATEYRNFESSQPNFFRIRDRVTVKYEYSKKLKFSLYDELFVHLVKNKGYKSIDHNRLGAGIEYNLLPKLKFELGYINVIKTPFSTIGKSGTHVFYLNLGYKL